MTRILLVEDDRDVRMLLEHVLRAGDYEVDGAATATEARSRLRSRSYDLVIADRFLDDGSGVAIADEAIDRGMKAFLITGDMFHVSRDDVERHEFLMKPVRPLELLRTVSRVLGAA